MSAPLHQRPGGASVDTGAMHACRADACRQGRTPCPCPDACTLCDFERAHLSRAALLGDLAIVLAAFAVVCLFAFFA